MATVLAPPGWYRNPRRTNSLSGLWHHAGEQMLGRGCWGGDGQGAHAHVAQSVNDGKARREELGDDHRPHRRQPLAIDIGGANMAEKPLPLLRRALDLLRV